ncbi:type VII toxin-antitoxin system HepT family RNase toxin [Spirochaeta isovalerica]|uniref:Uncharacterized protein YutE (UPF0331/DUF86 family) n=1 Tax=Spirochaeta isovalerica TaxID=150 RepID=A0A841RAQ3_9SPIO|nr:DUF86 domain-containing protein [Spirochaeta isovalerica]MBB6479512.1 uncharacterized protein YutE (UPF0331/DUF86 family) [Spirochaeta isovalerica]
MNKSAIIERSLRRMREEYNANPQLDNFTHIDALILNLERACQAAIDLAQHLVAIKHLGMPQNSAESFHLLENSGIISSASTKSMIAMTGFRNIVIHEYQKLDMGILKQIVEEEYKSLILFCKEIGIEILVNE